MDYIIAAIADLREYKAQLASIQNLKDAIAECQAGIDQLHTTQYDKTPVMGGESGYEERILTNMDKIKRLNGNLSIARSKAARVDRGMAALDDEERIVLERMYVNSEREAIRRLCEDLNCEIAQVYRIRRRALNRFTRAMYGILDI